MLKLVPVPAAWTTSSVTFSLINSNPVNGEMASGFESKSRYRASKKPIEAMVTLLAGALDRSVR